MLFCVCMCPFSCFIHFRQGDVPSEGFRLKIMWLFVAIKPTENWKTEHEIKCQLIYFFSVLDFKAAWRCVHRMCFCLSSLFSALFRGAMAGGRDGINRSQEGPISCWSACLLSALLLLPDHHWPPHQQTYSINRKRTPCKPRVSNMRPGGPRADPSRPGRQFWWIDFFFLPEFFTLSIIRKGGCSSYK